MALAQSLAFRYIALQPYLAFYEPFCGVFGYRSGWNLLEKRSWGFLELFYGAAVTTKFIPACRGKSNLNFSTSEALTL